MNTGQLFTRQPKITLADKKRLSPHLSTAAKLNEIFILGAITDPDDIKRLIVLELKDRKRVSILDKLVSRLKTSETRILRNKLIVLCQQNQS